ncbi:hypothetical protein F4703DRAFT_1855813 [Phycomyces blakesleeanus]
MCFCFFLTVVILMYHSQLQYDYLIYTLCMNCRKCIMDDNGTESPNRNRIQLTKNKVYSQVKSKPIMLKRKKIYPVKLTSCENLNTRFRIIFTSTFI